MVRERSLAATLNAKTLGSGQETVVLAHGYGGDQSVWDKVAPRLAARCRVVVFDWCFSGAVKDASLYDAGRYGSYDEFAEDLIGVLDELGLQSTVFVGHSMSGIIGCIASIKRPDLFLRLVLVGSSPRLTNMEDYEGGLDKSGVEQIFSSIGSDFEQWTSNFASLVVDSSDPPSIKKFANCLKSMRPEVALSLAKTVFLGDYRDVLENVTTPCNIIQSKVDLIVPNTVPKYMQEKIKGDCKVDIVDTTGHFPQLTAHDQFVEVMNRLLGC